MAEQNQKNNRRALITSLVNRLGVGGYELEKQLLAMDQDQLDEYVRVLTRPDLDVRYSETASQLSIRTWYGTVNMDGNDLTKVLNVYVNGQEYSTNPEVSGIDAMHALTSSNGEVMLALDEPVGRQATGRRARRPSRRQQTPVALEDVQATAFEDLSRANLTYADFYTELSSICKNANFEVNDLMGELCANGVPEQDIAQFLIYESNYNEQLLSAMYNYNAEATPVTYNYEAVHANDGSFAGRLLGALEIEEGQYDAEKGVLSVMDNGVERKITNLPTVDENGVFHNRHGEVETSYLPYYIGYFDQASEAGATRVDRLRVIDPVEQSFNGVFLQYKLSKGDIKFKTVLDVTRNLPDFDNHPYGQEILDTMKKKVVLASSYSESNSLLAEFNNRADELGAVALTMTDKEAEGVIDPLGTSNGRNLGMIFYLTKDAQINEDGTITPGESKYSAVGEIMSRHHVDMDNFNRNQMSFNAFLTSTDIQTRKVFVGEFALWNMEDALVLTNDMDGTVKVGDKMEDMHGNKGVVSVILSQLTEEEIKEKHLEHAVEFAKNNPDVDIITSPSNIQSRLNMGIPYEALDGQKSDVVLPNGSIVKDGCVELMYMKLPQTAEHKSVDYGDESVKRGRRYSTLLRHAITAKVGDEMYRKAFVDENARAANMEKCISSFGRLGISFKDETKLVEPGNVNLYADAPVTISADDLHNMTPQAVRLKVGMAMAEAGSRSVNIDLGDMAVYSRFLKDGDGREAPIKDSEGRNVLPIRVGQDEVVPYRYTELFAQIASGNTDGVARAYRQISNVDYSALTRKDNIIKNIDTMVFKKGASTLVMVPDPSLGLNDARVNGDCNRFIFHRDPAIQCGNALSLNNVGGGAPGCAHVNPLMETMVDGDNDGDTSGKNDYDNLNLTPEEKEIFFNKTNVTDRVNFYGEVKLGTGSSYFKGCAKAAGIDISDITFEDGKSNEELVALVEEKTRQILDSPESYGAYAISFTDIESVKESMCRMADDGIKGKREDIEKRLMEGYSHEDNVNVAKACIAKAEWTGLAGAVTNNMIANLPEEHYDLLRVGMDITWSQTQSTLQMKHNAEKLPIINEGISKMKNVFAGGQRGSNTPDARKILYQCTEGMLPKAAVDEFVDKVAEAQGLSRVEQRLKGVGKDGKPVPKFGEGILSAPEKATTRQLAYMSANAFGESIAKIGEMSEAQKAAQKAPADPRMTDGPFTI